jgi:hypothetical protein
VEARPATLDGQAWSWSNSVVDRQQRPVWTALETADLKMRGVIGAACEELGAEVVQQ